MEYRKLGKSGLDVSVIGLGAITFGDPCDRSQTADVIAAARASGINVIDTADVYGGRGLSEEYVGDAIRGERHDWVVMTKFGFPMDEGPSQQPTGSRGYIRRAVEASLRRLRVDYIDVYQIHRPDPDTPAEETMSALHDLVIEGKVRYIGCSNYGGWQIAESNGITQGRGWTPFVSSQPAYNVLNRRAEREHIPACAHYGLGVIPWGPLAGGFLTGKYRRDEPFPEGTRMATNEWARPVLTGHNDY
jgi:aryl-alcohol dehydrogenase-like predicted oxidoreductase